MTNRNRRCLYAVPLALIFAFYYACGTFFWHSHVVGSQVVTHSHPFSSAQHTTSDLRTISGLFSFAADDSIITPQELHVYTYLICIRTATPCPDVLSATVRHYHLRAPPSAHLA